MADPPRRITENGTELVLVDPLDRRLSQDDRRALSLEELRGIEDELLEESASGISAGLAWPEITPETEEPPAEWVAALGAKKAHQKLRVAKAAWLPTKDAPVGLKLFQNVYLGIARVRAADKAPAAQLNYTVVELAVPPPQFPEKEVEGRK